MRIAVVCPYSIDVPGGAQGQALGLARVFAERSLPVRLVAPGLSDTRDDHGIDVVRIGRAWSIPVNGSRAPVAPYPSAWRSRAHAALAEFRPDVVHVHEPLVPGPSFAALAPIVAPTVGTFHRAGDGRFYRALRPVLQHFASRLAARVAVSDAAASTARDALGSDLVIDAVLANAVDVAHFATAVPSPSRGPTVVFVGRHEPRKGLSVLLDAFSGLADDTQLWVVGEGPETAALRARYGDERVTWLGALGNTEMAARLRGADVFVAPSLAGESFGVVLLEAMAAGTPVVASDLEGYRLAGGDAARFVPPGDPHALAAAVRGLLEDPGARSALVAAGDAVAAHRSFGALADAYLELFERVTP